MDYSKNSIGTLAILSLFLGGFMCLCIWTPSTNSSIFFYGKNLHLSNTVSKDELDIALEKASMANKTVIIAVVNKAYVEPHKNVYPTMFDLFLEGFWNGEETRPLVKHLLVVAMDQTAYERCRFQGLHCYKLKTDGVDFSGEKLFMSNDFIKMMWGRTKFLLDVLNRGYNFIFTDTDILWFRDPFSKLSKNSSEDLQISTDTFNGDPWSEKNSINTGFYFIKSNNKTISLFETWYAMRNTSKGMKEQDVLISLMHKGVFRKLGLRVRFLDTLFFSGFCSDSKDVKLVATVHANCCRSISAKVADLKAVLTDWKKFKEFPMGNIAPSGANNGLNNFQWTKHISCANSWHTSNGTLS